MLGVPSHVQVHAALDMVAQQGQTLPEGSNTEPRPTQPAPDNLVPLTMAAYAGAHDPAAMASGPANLNVLELFDLPVSPPKMKDSVMGGPTTRRAASTNSRERSRDRERSAPRGTSVKRGNDTFVGRPPRGRPESPWEDDIRAVHRRVQYPDDPTASVPAALTCQQIQLYQELPANPVQD